MVTPSQRPVLQPARPLRGVLPPDLLPPFFQRRLAQRLTDGRCIEHDGQYRADAPADGPGQPDAGAAQSCSTEDDGHAHAQDQVREGSHHEAAHQTAAAQDAVGDQLEGHHKVEGRKDVQEQHASVDGRGPAGHS